LVLEHNARYCAIAAVIEMIVLGATVRVDKVEKKKLPSL
jgi:hypothetical protein